MNRCTFWKFGLAISAVLLPSLAHAQQAQGTAQVGVQGQAQTGMQLPSSSPPPATPPPTTSDHDAFIGRWAVGYLGRRGVEIGAPPTLPNPPALIEAPVIGVRYWLDRMIGIDAGVGLNFQGGDGPSQTAVILHGGVPLSLAAAGHFSFQVVPELNLGFGSWSQDVPAPGGISEYSARGFLIDVGARAGAEIHFGFMGIPQLSLQGSVGAYLGFSSLKGNLRPPAGPQVSQSTDRFHFGTSYRSGDNPWDIFTGNVAALYYF